MVLKIIKDLVVKNESKIVLLVLDGLGGLPLEKGGKTELATAKTPNMDKLAKDSTLGLFDPIYPGITPGSGPAHFAIFGYDPVECNIGRGVLEVCGIDYELKKGDVCARFNFATTDKSGAITDRRAGRISTETNQRLCEKLSQIKSNDAEIIIKTVKEHRGVLIMRGKGLCGDLHDTDPQKTGLKTLEPYSPVKEGEKTVKLVKMIVEKANAILKDEDKANTILLRGFAEYHPYESFDERFGLNALAIASYPMYRGLARLVGMTVAPAAEDFDQEIDMLKENYSKYDYFFVHFKKTDSYGEDGNFDAKVKAIEKVDKLLPEILNLKPDVLIITGDHSTPALLKGHSWHPNPVLVYSRYCRPDTTDRFDEESCIHGGLGRMAAVHLMPLAMANALKLQKFGA